jgi:hypothetical protein
MEVPLATNKESTVSPVAVTTGLERGMMSSCMACVLYKLKFGHGKIKYPYLSLSIRDCRIHPQCLMHDCIEEWQGRIIGELIPRRVPIAKVIEEFFAKTGLDGWITTQFYEGPLDTDEKSGTARWQGSIQERGTVKLIEVVSYPARRRVFI